MGVRSLWTRWKVIAEKIGHFQTMLILSVVYFVVVSPFALVVRFLKDPLRIRKIEESNWIEKGSLDHTIETARKQY